MLPLTGIPKDQRADQERPIASACPSPPHSMESSIIPCGELGVTGAGSASR